MGYISKKVAAYGQFVLVQTKVINKYYDKKRLNRIRNRLFPQVRIRIQLILKIIRESRFALSDTDPIRS